MSKRQEKETVYMRFISSKLILVRFEPGCLPTTQALNAGVTIIMHHYGLPKNDCTFIERSLSREAEQDAKAFLGEIHQDTKFRWRAKWNLWDWTVKGPVLFALSITGAF